MPKRYIDIVIDRNGEEYYVQDRRLVDGSTEGDVVIDGNVYVTDPHTVYVNSNSDGSSGKEVATKEYVGSVADELNQRIDAVEGNIDSSFDSIMQSVQQIQQDLQRQIDELKSDVLYKDVVLPEEGSEEEPAPEG